MCLSEPSTELAKKILSKVPWQNRLVGLTAHQTAGTMMVDIYSFEEAVNFLKSCRTNYSLDELLMKGSGATINYLDLSALANWVGDVLGDGELSEALKNVIGEVGENPLLAFREKVKPVLELMELRLRQCKAKLPEAP